MNLPDFSIAHFSSFVISASLCALIVYAARRWPNTLIPRADLRAVQAAHKQPTARLGGLAIILGLLGGGSLAYYVHESMAGGMLLFLLASLLPLVLAGLAEDLGIMVSPRRRLVAAFLSSLLALLLFQTWVTQVDLFPLDAVFSVAALAIPLTLIWGSGICHAFNLIDGVNGLSSGVAAIAATGLAAIAMLAGQPDIALIASILAAAIFGFMLFNWPRGKLFLGDMGAYALGHLLTWLGILLIARVPEVSFAAIIGLFFWPLADTVLAIYRRSLAGQRLDKPDRLHFHQLVMRGLDIGYFGRGRRHVSNPATTALILPLVAAGTLGHVLLWDNASAGYLFIVGQSLAFIAIYTLGMRFFRQPRKRNRTRIELEFTPELAKRLG